MSIRSSLEFLSKVKRIELQQAFLQQIVHECRRAERSKQRFLLVLIDGFATRQSEVPVFAASIAAITRATDTLGWYREGSTLGVVFAELGNYTPENSLEIVVNKVKAAILQAGDMEGLEVSAYVLPRDLNEKVALEDSAENIYQSIAPFSSTHGKLQLGIKRAIDFVGAVLLLIAFAPLMAVIALAIKLESKGPILFRQTRVGQGGKSFKFLKFRSMAAENNPSLHENYVKDFIKGTASKNANEKGEGVFKLTQDPRVTAVGKFLRKTSLDELPQFWNVLRGEMSLVGPRPPIPYEVKCYDLWHQRRVLEVKPGITGLWQVSGRSRTCFDDMVRLDLRYVRTWSPWLDIKILLQTPLAVLRAGGAH